jgi:hypothetical protein
MRRGTGAVGSLVVVMVMVVVVVVDMTTVEGGGKIGKGEGAGCGFVTVDLNAFIRLLGSKLSSAILRLLLTFPPIPPIPPFPPIPPIPLVTTVAAVLLMPIRVPYADLSRKAASRFAQTSMVTRITSRRKWSLISFIIMTL